MSLLFTKGERKRYPVRCTTQNMEHMAGEHMKSLCQFTLVFFLFFLILSGAYASPLTYFCIEAIPLQDASSLPDPAQLSRTPFGTYPLYSHEIYRIARTIAHSSNRVKVIQYGTTWEGRPLYHFVVSSPENIKQYNTFKMLWRSAYEGETVPHTLPLQVWLIGSVHGNEHSSSEALLGLMYILAYSNDAQIQSLLKHVVVVFDLIQNPDGRDRFVMHVRQSLGRFPDAWAWAEEHRETWPTGRYNHYWFDLNRDWAFQTQKETRHRIETFFEAPPQVVVDFHEMGWERSYYFAPPAEPILDILPSYIRKFWTIFGRANARMFDEHEWLYFIREVFDIFYPGYGDSFPSLHGAIGMTYEQASARGVVVQREDGSLLSLCEAIKHHSLAGFQTLMTASEHSISLLKNYVQFHKKLLQSSHDFMGWFIPAETDEAKRERLINRLERMRVSYTVLKGGQKLELADPYWGKEVGKTTSRSGDIFIPASQGGRLFLTVLLNRETRIPASFKRSAEERRQRGESPGFYDITAWSLPYAWDMPLYLVRTLPRELENVSEKEPTSQTVPDDVRYLLVCQPSLRIYQFAGTLLSQGISFMVLTKSAQFEKKTCARGSLVLRWIKLASHEKELVKSFIPLLARRILFLKSGWAEEGPSLGSAYVRPVLPRKKILLLTHSPTLPTSAGSLWYTLEQDYHFPIHRTRVELLARVSLKDVGVIIVPSVYNTNIFDTFLTQKGWKRLKNWVEEGGVLIVVGRSIQAFASHNWIHLKDEEKNPENKDLPSLPGVFVWARVREHSFFSSGVVRTRIPFFIWSNTAYFPDVKDRQIIVRIPEEGDVKASGFFWDDTLEHFRGSALVWEQRMGRGLIFAFAGEPSFRSDFLGAHPFLLNAILYGLMP